MLEKCWKNIGKTSEKLSPLNIHHYYNIRKKVFRDSSFMRSELFCEIVGKILEKYQKYLIFFHNKK
jgi:hypothetical protein